ncbi:MAG: FAD-dependent oxidoreductase, partial [Flavobacteriaceae bacterium]
MVDYILVGLGLAGIAFCEKLEAHKKSYIVFDAGKEASSSVAGGLYNPVILKRFTPAWNAADQIKRIDPFYRNLESKLGVKLDYKQPVYRIFHSVEEQNLWFEALDKPQLEPFLSQKIHPNKNKVVVAPFGFGEVLHSGRIDTATLLEKYRDYLLKQDKLIENSFEHHKLQVSDALEYGSIKAKQIVFAEGFGLKHNPFFKNLPLVGNKGELLTIRAPELKLVTIVKSSIFIIPLGKDLYRVGATYNWKDKSVTTTKEAKEELLLKLDKIMKCSYEVVVQDAGIRPTVADRKPLVGRHPVYEE